MMICGKCISEPVARGVKQIVCLRCGEKTLTNVEYTALCTICATELERCIKCGKKITE